MCEGRLVGGAVVGVSPEMWTVCEGSRAWTSVSWCEMSRNAVPRSRSRFSCRTMPMAVSWSRPINGSSSTIRRLSCAKS